MSFRSTARRAALFTSAAVSAFAATSANAQGHLSLVNATDAAHSGNSLSIADAADTAFAQDRFLGGNYLSIADVSDAPNITINNNFTPTDIRDPVNITGIGQIVRDAGGGSVGLCTGTLINPRTVIFAAHCVNGAAATTYGQNAALTGGTGIAVAFETNTRANAPGQSDELVNWLLGGSTGPGRFRTNEAQALYNILQVFWHPGSRAPASCTSATSCFLEADLAIGALDTPARNIPQWTMLFSPLASPAAINPATGTGYHVTIAGYGQNGTGTTGAAGSDFRRRVAENMLGALTSINARNLFLFGTTGTPSRPQLLYWTDFDDPARGTAAANVRDFNGFRDNALTREGITGPGDSGGPLIIDQAFARPTIIGILSGGSTFFAGQPQSSYGTQSFYQPLFLYWDWVVANNPYRYVQANAGDRNWEDAATWVTTLDPAYQILVGGQLVNGLPTELGGSIVATTPQFGEVCFQSPLNTPAPPAVNECQNLATGAARNNVPNTPTGTGDVNSPVLTVQIGEATPPASEQPAAANVVASEQAQSVTGRLSLADASDTAISERLATGGSVDVAIGDTAAIAGGIDGAIESPFAAPGFRDGPVPAPSLANGLPGATNFVPNNTDGVRATGVSARYFDVTLRNAGTISLSSTVTIDRLTLALAGAGLRINGNGTLTSLIDITQTAGTMTVTGALRSNGDYALMGGLLQGAGVVTTPFLTSVLGTIAPGTVGSIGTLTVSGNIVMSSGTQTAIDLFGMNVSDILRTTANGTSNGQITLGGALVLNAASRPTFGAFYEGVVRANSNIVGTFSSANALSAILFPVVTYNSNAVNVRIDARSYVSVVNPNSPVQLAFARLLDGNRGNYALLADLYGETDAIATAALLQTTLEAAAPRTEATIRSMGQMSTDALTRFYRDRISFLESGQAGGTLTLVGNPVRLASAAISGTMNNMLGGLQTMSDTAGAAAMVQQQHGALPDHVSLFLAGGFLDGRADPLPSLVGGRDDIDGFYIAAGVELQAAERTMIGFGVHYADTSGQSTATQSADGELVQANFYTVGDVGNGVVINGQISLGRYAVDTRRVVTAGATTFTLLGQNAAFAASGEIGLGRRFDMNGLTLTPNVAARYSLLDFGEMRETGGGMALVIDGPQYESFQGRIGLDLGGSIDSGSMTISPRLTAAFVHEFLDQPNAVIAGFAASGFRGGAQPFLLPNADRNWGEIGGALRVSGSRVSFDLGIDTTVGRGDVNYRTYRAGVAIRF